MIDIHHHLLWGLDDGPKDLATSVAMVELAAADGITHIVATPHANDTWSYNRDQNEAMLQQLREALPPNAQHVQLGLGCDFHITWDNTQDAHIHRTRYTINQHEYLLIELPDQNIPKNLPEVLYNLRVDGLTPILTHPERNISLQRSPEQLQYWVRDGLLVQVTAGSITGRFGPTAEKMAWQLLQQNSVHFIATDAHNLDRRPPQMSKARNLIAERMSNATADLLTVTNPLSVYEGRPLPAQTSSSLPGDTEEDKPSLWQRLFRR